MINKLLILLLFFFQVTITGKEINKKNSIKIQLNLGGLYFQNGHPANNSYLKTYGNEVTKIINGDIEYNFEPKKKMATRLELEADNNRAGVIRIKDAWFQLPIRKHTTVRFGNSKKDLGFKGSMGSFKRRFYERSLMYRYLRSFDIFDYDIMIRTKVNHQIKNIEPQYIAAFGADEDQRIFVNLCYSLKIKHSTFKISDLFVNHVDTRFDKQNSNHFVFGYRHKTEKWNKSIEFFTGIDPDASNQLHYMNTDKIVHYFGSELEFSHLFKLEEEKVKIIKGFEPIIQAGWLSNDLEKSEDGFLEMRAAFNVLLNKPIKARWHTGYGYVLQKSSIASETWTGKSSTISSVVQINW